MTMQADSAPKKRGRKKKTDPAWSDVADASAKAQAEEKREPPRHLTMDLPCKLTEGEHAERGGELAKVLEEIQALKDGKKAAAQEWKARIEIAEAHARALTKICRHKSEERSVECIEEKIYATGVCRIVRVDTGELVSERALTALERQPVLFGSTEASGDPDEEDRQRDLAYQRAADYADSDLDVDDPEGLLSGAADEQEDEG